MKHTLIVLLLILTTQLCAQTETNLFFQQSLKVENTSMIALGAWAAGNLAVSLHGLQNTDGETLHFHQMNTAWSSINLALVGLHFTRKLFRKETHISNTQLMSAHKKIERILLYNTALDMGYIALGIGLKQLADTPNGNFDLLTGYGNALLLQGSFLLLFDAIFYSIQYTRRKKFLKQMPLGLTMNTNGIGLRYTF